MARQPIEDWAHLPWRKLGRVVYRLQTRIFRASERGNVQAVHSLQRLLMKSEAARCLAVRRVTQDNQGKHTAGVDGVKSVPPAQRVKLVALLGQPDAIKPRPTRRVWIPKPGSKTEKRPLGIPVMLDRAHQALVKLALEPEWEARFEPNTYGFRPGRSVHDAIGALFQMLCFHIDWHAQTATCPQGKTSIAPGDARSYLAREPFAETGAPAAHLSANRVKK